MQTLEQTEQSGGTKVRRDKVLVVDDQQELLDMYRDWLSNLPSRPEVHSSSTGARAIALLESESFDLLVTDLRMPKMDGLQVLAIVRRKFPSLRVVVLTGVTDEAYRSRAYSMGVDLFCQKPTTKEEAQGFEACVESLLGREKEVGGFRGVQSKSLMDIIQLECLSQSSSVLRIIHHALDGKIWVQGGEVIDAQTGTLAGEAAFKEIMSWKTGSFEILPAEPDRPRSIHSSYHGLLLDSAQAMDESHTDFFTKSDTEIEKATGSPMAKLARFEGVEFVLEAANDGKAPRAWGVENPEVMLGWARQTRERLKGIGNLVQGGPLGHVQGNGLQRHVTLSEHEKGTLCIGFRRDMSAEQVLQTTK
ncbi:MAG: response regulator, partial [Limisphaerales bacterium]